MNHMFKVAILGVAFVFIYIGYGEYKKHTYCNALANKREFPAKSALPQKFYELSGKLELTKEMKLQLDKEREFTYKKCMVSI